MQQSSPELSAVDAVYEVLYDRIINGKYPPGLRMSQNDLALELNTSRTPLREALNRLHANGLLVATRNRGMEVASVSYDETEQMYAMRLLIEPPLIYAMVNELSDRDIDAMDRALEAMESSRYVTQAYQESHHSFHKVALNRYPSAIREIIENIYQKIHRHQQLHFSRPHVPDDFSNVDRCFLEAIRARNPLLARQWLQFHLLDAGLGLALDLNPDKLPDSLVMAARGIGIRLASSSADAVSRPFLISWTSRNALAMQPMETINLKYEPPVRDTPKPNQD